MTSGLGDGPRASFLRGVELFNSGEYWESHEAWETVWNAVTGEERLFWQGLIQAAAALVHRQRENPHGIRVLGAKALDKLDRFGPAHGGIDLGRFRSDLRAALAGGPWPRISLIEEGR